MIAAGALLVTMHLRAVLDEPFDDLMRATNGAHVSVVGSPDAVARAAAHPEVAEAGEPRREVQVEVGLSPGSGRLVISGLPANPDVDRPLVDRRAAPAGGG